MSTVGTSLCTSCGLCCSGALFPRTVLKREELSWARGKQLLDVLDDARGASFAQPCGLLDARKCVAYEERPAVCRSYQCKLLRALEAGEITMEAAQAKVQRLQDIYARVSQLVTPTSVEALLDLGELQALADRDFRDPPT